MYVHLGEEDAPSALWPAVRARGMKVAEPYESLVRERRWYAA